ncbi:MAG: replication initiation protein, partial [Campylobacterota bacterium]|nr:replication initiation protein [Campylobacterota bacterium]
MNILQAKKKKEEQLLNLYLPKEVDLAINLIHTFIKNIGKNKANTLGLKLAIVLSGARNKIEYDEYNRVKFEVDELCEICKINRRQLSSQIKKVISTKYHFTDTNGDTVGTTPIHTYRYTRDNKYIYISVSQEAKKLFGELGRGGYRFTQALTDNLFDLKHKHSLRMQLFLEMINNYNNNSSKKIEMNLEEINGYFGVNYKNMYDIERKILKPVQDEITHSSTLTFKYDFTDTVSGGRPKIDKVIIDVIDNSNSLFALDRIEPETKSPTTNTLEKQKAHTRATRERKAKLSLTEEIEIYEEIKKEIDIEVFFAINKVEDEATKDYYLKKQSEFINYCIEKNKDYKDYFESFMRYIEIGKQNNW